MTTIAELKKLAEARELTNGEKLLLLRQEVMEFKAKLEAAKENLIKIRDNWPIIDRSIQWTTTVGFSEAIQMLSDNRSRATTALIELDGLTNPATVLDLIAKLEQSEADNFVLSAGACICVRGDEHGNAYCVMKAKLENAKEALRPFKDDVELWGQLARKNYYISQDSNATFSDLRRAATTLAELEKEDE